MVVDSEIKKQKIKEICSQQIPERRIPIGEIDKNKKFDVFKIPLDLLTLNPKNSRFESEHRKIYNFLLDPKWAYKKEGQEKIKKLILNQNKLKNESTRKDLITKGQQEPAVITNDGLLISGNRRFSIIQDINENYERYPFSDLKAVVLLDYSSGDLKKIKELELKTQFGKDSAEKYSRLDTMLAMREYKQFGKSNKEIEEHFNWKETGGFGAVEKILKQMDDYLNYVKMPGNYEHVKEREDQFKYLEKAISTLQKEPGKVALDGWALSSKDRQDFTNTMYKFSRFQPEGKKFREIVKVTTSAHILKDKNIWDKFQESVKKMYEVGEKIRTDIKQKTPKINFDELEKKVVKEIKTKKNNNSEDILTDAVYAVKQLGDRHKPDKLLENLEKSINSITDYCNEIIHVKKEMKKEIRNLNEDLSQLVSKLFDVKNEQ